MLEVEAGEFEEIIDLDEWKMGRSLMDVLAEVKESKSLVDNASDQDQEKKIIEPEKLVALCRKCGEKEPVSPGSP